MFSARVITLAALSLIGLMGNVALAAPDESFVIAIIPDTQNYVDYKQQKAEGFPFDSSALFLEQMRYIAENAKAKGGDIVFALNVGDMKQHFSLDMDADHKARGFKRVPNPPFSDYETPVSFVRSQEIPLLVQGYKILDGVLPFSVVPGNHDYDSFWTDAAHPPQPEKSGALRNGLFHYDGLEDFCSAFSDQSPFFKGKPWYVGSHDCGADSAQIFEAGGYRFLQIGLQYNPPDESLKWAQSMVDRFPGLPTIVSTHNFLAPNGRRADEPLVDSERNQPNAVWDKFIKRNDQILLVLSGHRCAQAFRPEKNAHDHFVYQVLSDFQCRWQVAKDAGLTATAGGGLGDGWLRLMKFDLASRIPRVHVRTYSTHYKKFSTDVPDYAKWYRAEERPNYLEEEYLAEDDFEFELLDFHKRFRNSELGPTRAKVAK